MKSPFAWWSRDHHRPTVAAAIAMLLAILLIIGASIVAAWLTIRQTTTLLAVLGVILGGGAFLLTVAAAVVATLAYGAVIAIPELRVEVRFGHDMPPMTLRFDPPNGQGFRRISQFIQCDAHVYLINDSVNVSARNPAVKLQFYSLGAFPKEDLGGWVAGNHRHGWGWTSAQWDGGSNYSVHPKWRRELPILPLYALQMMPGEEPSIWIEVVADGFTDRYQLPVQFDGEVVAPSRPNFNPLGIEGPEDPRAPWPQAGGRGE